MNNKDKHNNTTNVNSLEDLVDGLGIDDSKFESTKLKSLLKLLPSKFESVVSVLVLFLRMEVKIVRQNNYSEVIITLPKNRDRITLQLHKNTVADLADFVGKMDPNPNKTTE